jgi:hypothetical protein
MGCQESYIDTNTRRVKGGGQQHHDEPRRNVSEATLDGAVEKIQKIIEMAEDSEYAVEAAQLGGKKDLIAKELAKAHKYRQEIEERCFDLN